MTRGKPMKGGVLCSKDYVSSLALSLWSYTKRSDAAPASVIEKNYLGELLTIYKSSLGTPVFRRKARNIATGERRSCLV